MRRKVICFGEELLSKYGMDRRGWTSQESRNTYGISLWKYIRNGWNAFVRNVGFKVGNGAKVGFWQDNWCEGGPLKDRFPSMFQISNNKEALASDFLCMNGDNVSWNPMFIRDFHDWELEEVHLFLETIHLSKVSGVGSDTMVWMPSKRAKFEVKSYYNVLSDSNKEGFPWKSIWKTKAPPRVAFFAWTAAWGRILTGENLRRRGMILVDRCAMCKVSGEAVDHLLLHCQVAADIWFFFFTLFGFQWVMPATVKDLLFGWNLSIRKSKWGDVWRMVPLCVMWHIWMERNARIFEDQEGSSVALKSKCLKALHSWDGGALSSSMDFVDFVFCISNH